MTIAVTASGPELSDQVDPRFGRSPYFLFVDPDSMEFEAVENPNAGEAGGAGIQSAGMVSDKGAEALLTGTCGPNAFKALQAAGVKVVFGASGPVQQAIQRYNAGELQPSTQPDVPPDVAAGPGAGRGRGGPGRGMGRGRGRGSGHQG